MSTTYAIGEAQALEQLRVTVLEDLNYNEVDSRLDQAVWWARTTLSGIISGMGGMLEEAGKTAAKTLIKKELMLCMEEIKACGLLVESSGSLVDGLITGNFEVADALTLTVQKVFDNSTAVKIGAGIVGQFSTVIEKSQNNGFGWITAYLQKYCYDITKIEAVYSNRKDAYTLLDDIMEEVEQR